MGGTENHDPETEGPWEDRLAAARQAFFEWIPIRENPARRLYRTLKYGDLADIIMLDTRIEGREQQASAPFYCDETDPALPKQMLGEEQEAWVFEELSTSNAKWRILGNQVVMSLWKTSIPSQLANNDQWHCYPSARNALVGFLRDQAVPNVVVVTGDVHTSWAMDVTVGDGSYDSETRQGAVAVESVAPGITGPTPFPVPALEDVIFANSHVRYAELTRKGYLVLDVQSDKVQSDWYLLDGVNENEGQRVPRCQLGGDGRRKATRGNERPGKPPLGSATSRKLRSSRLSVNPGVPCGRARMEVNRGESCRVCGPPFTPQSVSVFDAVANAPP
jgi:alkaline phosphatase D